MSRIKDDEREYIEKFIREYRTDLKGFVKSASSADQEIIDKTLFSMERYEKEKKNHEQKMHKFPLTFEKASQYVKKNWLGRKNRRKISEIVRDDDMKRKGTDEGLAAHAFKVWLDKARSLNLICVSEDVPQQLKDCTEKKTECEKQLREAQEEIERLRNLVLLLHGNPDKTDKTFREGVE